ncbi:MAG: hypothetical protein JNL11_09315 [Bdellovibrionaceae bacterium]|nr:hypothetical protein [Pseudobdellovibrionaceae bacterium]
MKSMLVIATFVLLAACSSKQKEVDTATVAGDAPAVVQSVEPAESTQSETSKVEENKESTDTEKKNKKKYRKKVASKKKKKVTQ